MLNLYTTLALLAPTTAPSTAPALPAALESPPFAMLVAADAGREPNDFSYTYVELGYAATDLDTIDDDAKGLQGRASLGLLDFLFVFLDYSNQTTDFQNSDSDAWGLGAGAHVSLMPRFDLVGEAAWLSNDISSDLSTLDDSNSGWTARAGARWMPQTWDGGGLELDGGYRWIDMKGLLSDEKVGAWDVGARVHFLKVLSVGAQYTFLEQDRQWGLNLRLSF